MLKKNLFIVILTFTITSIHAQYSSGLNSEIGLSVGIVNFKGDFGERNNFQNYIQNNGYIVTGFYYFTPETNYSSFIDYFKLRLEVSYMNCNLAHYGKSVDPSNNGIFANQLRQMVGNVQASTFGAQIEYYPLGQDEYTREQGFIPYLGLGGQLSNYSSKISSSLGPIGSPISTPIKYLNGGARAKSSGIVPSISTSIGTRYKLTPFTSLVLDLRLQYYFSDWVDGMNPDKSLYTENKSNDWLTSFNVGYIYYFE
jgi:hypothetical protein